MAFYEHYITEYTRESGRCFWTLPEETLDGFAASSAVCVVISYNNGSVDITEVQDTFEVELNNSQYIIHNDKFTMNFTTGACQCTTAYAPNSSGLHVQLTGIAVNFVRPTSTVLVSLQQGSSTVEYEFVPEEDIVSAEIFCRALASDGVTEVEYVWSGTHSYNAIVAGTHVTNILDVREMFDNSAIAAVNGRQYTISIRIQKEDYFYSFDWAIFRLADGQRMVLRSTAGDTVTPEKLLAGATAHKDEERITGTMPNRGAQTSVISSVLNPSISIAEGYHNGNGSVTVDTSNINAGNIKKNVTILGITGSYEGGSSGPDLSRDTVSASVLANGYTAHDKDGNAIVGSYVPITETPTGDGAYTIEITTV